MQCMRSPLITLTVIKQSRVPLIEPPKQTLALILQIWDTNTGERYHTLRGHELEIVCLQFAPQGDLIATGSMDNNAKLWDVETGQEIVTLQGHTAEIVSLHFNTEGDKILTGSFDTTAKVGSDSIRYGISGMEHACRL